MKNSFVSCFIFFSLLLLTSCEKDASVHIIDDSIPLQEALSSLDSFMSDAFPETKAGIIYESIDSFGAKDIPKTKGSEENICIPDTLVYLVNFFNEEGFAILSANRRLTSNIFAVTEKGSISSADLCNAYDLLNNPTLSHETENSIQAADSSIVSAILLSSILLQFSQQDNNTSSSVLETKSSPILISKFGPYLKTKWHQNSPFTDVTLASHAGCTAIATGQIVVANRVSNSMVFNNKLCSWDTLETIAHYSDPYNYGSTEARSQAADFMKIIGDSNHCDINYNTGVGHASGAKRAFQALGYSNVQKYTGFGDMNQTRCISAIMNGKSVYMGGARTITLYGHAWVLDGHIYRDENSSLKSYLHINWGWNGDRDGYYECGVFDTTAGSFKDEEIDSNTSLDSGGVEANYFWTYRIVTYDLP